MSSTFLHKFQISFLLETCVTTNVILTLYLTIVNIKYTFFALVFLPLFLHFEHTKQQIFTSNSIIKNHLSIPYRLFNVKSYLQYYQHSIPFSLKNNNCILGTHFRFMFFIHALQIYL